MPGDVPMMGAGYAGQGASYSGQGASYPVLGASYSEQGASYPGQGTARGRSMTLTMQSKIGTICLKNEFHH